jgi:5,5'-dehydrodivanillate O-demethylase
MIGDSVRTAANAHELGQTTVRGEGARSVVHTDPGTPAGTYLRRYWHPIYISAELETNWSKPIRIMGQNLTLYRGESGAAHLVAARCAHRGLQLSAGIVEGEEIRCAYHGWKYRGDGQCIQQPCEPKPFAEKIRIGAYPVREYLGLIFAYLGVGQPPEFPRYPHLEDGGLVVAWGLAWPFNYFQHLENAIDETHFSFLHALSRFKVLNFDVPKISAEETDFGLVQYGERSNGVVRKTYYHMPNATSWMQPSEFPEETDWRESIGWRVPIDDVSHYTYMLRHYHCSTADVPKLQDRLDEDRRELAKLRPFPEIVADVLAGRMRWQDIEFRHLGTDMTLIEDQVANAGQGAIADQSNEHLGNADAAIVLLRRIWQRELRTQDEGLPLKRWAATMPKPTAGM